MFNSVEQKNDMYTFIHHLKKNTPIQVPPIYTFTQLLQVRWGMRQRHRYAKCTVFFDPIHGVPAGHQNSRNMKICTIFSNRSYPGVFFFYIYLIEVRQGLRWVWGLALKNYEFYRTLHYMTPPMIYTLKGELGA